MAISPASSTTNPEPMPPRSLGSADSPNSEELARWGVKRKSNDELRQRFVNQTVAQAKAINLTLPDPDLSYDEKTENWNFGKIDWDEFWRVVKGDGPCNRERIAARRSDRLKAECAPRSRDPPRKARFLISVRLSRRRERSFPATRKSSARQSTRDSSRRRQTKAA